MSFKEFVATYPEIQSLTKEEQRIQYAIYIGDMEMSLEY